jgi:hypothetical protein
MPEKTIDVFFFADTQAQAKCHVLAKYPDAEFSDGSWAEVVAIEIAERVRNGETVTPNEVRILALVLEQVIDHREDMASEAKFYDR